MKNRSNEIRSNEIRSNEIRIRRGSSVRIILRKNSDHSDLGQLEPGTVTSNASCTVGYLEKLPVFVSGIQVIPIGTLTHMPK